MKISPSDRELLTAQLLDSLDDAHLKKVFPDLQPDEVRRILSNKTLSKKKPEAKPKAKTGQTSLEGIQCSLYTDGASRGNPGKAGAGAVIFNDTGDEIGTCSEYLGTCTNNVAEYKALILGLEKALSLGCQSIAINLDSELIVKQVKGQYKVKNAALKPLFIQVKTLLNKLPAWSIQHVPRSQNSRADQLANKGIDSSKST